MLGAMSIWIGIVAAVFIAILFYYLGKNDGRKESSRKNL